MQFKCFFSLISEFLNTKVLLMCSYKDIFVIDNDGSNSYSVLMIEQFGFSKPDGECGSYYGNSFTLLMNERN